MLTRNRYSEGIHEYRKHCRQQIAVYTMEIDYHLLELHEYIEKGEHAKAYPIKAKLANLSRRRDWEQKRLDGLNSTYQ